MTARRLTAILVAAGAVGCGGVSADAAYVAKMHVNVQPLGQPPIAGTYDFDLLQEVEGKGCADRSSPTYAVSLLGAHLGDGYGYESQSEAAAAFDAISKVKGADLLLITRSRAEGDPREKVCTIVFGRAVRLKKGPTLDQRAASEAAGAAAASASAAAAAAPVPVEPKPPEAPAPKKK